MRQYILFLFLLISCGPASTPSPSGTLIQGDPTKPDTPGETKVADTLPAAPTGLQVIAGDATVSLTWNAVTNADGYKASRAVVSGGPYTELAIVRATSYIDHSVTNGQRYYYTVQTMQAGLTSAYTIEVAAEPTVISGGGNGAPANPTGLTLLVLSGSSIRATWVDNATNETGYTIERATVNGAFGGVASLAADATTYTNAGLVTGTTYRFRVRAFNAQSASAYSDEVSAVTVGGTPGSMAAIPAGCFEMGDTFGEGIPQDGPAHTVCLTNGYSIDTHEITNGQYQACVTAGGCTAPAIMGSRLRISYYDDAGFGAYPVVYVTWDQAVAYCGWAGKRLPTEAEWEKAARGGLTGKRFPWGDTITCHDANYYTTEWDGLAYDIDPATTNQSCSGDTALAGAYAPNGFGLYDMAGNVLEWVQDRWDSFAAGTVTDPTGAVNGTDRVLKGGDHSHDAEWAKVSFRTPGIPTDLSYSYGFRCAQ